MYKIGEYEILGKIASGGMGTVYAAQRTGPGGFAKRVAIKQLHPRFEMQPDALSRFMLEARVGGDLSHPCIVDVQSIERDDDGYFIVMEYVHGVTLSRLISRCPAGALGAPEAVLAAREVLSGLEAAHGHRSPDGQPEPVVHRDLNPRNVLVSVAGAVKIADFGIANIMGAETLSGALRGTLSYMAPEQAVGERADTRTDIYAAGVILAELLLRRRLNPGESEVERLQAARDGLLRHLDLSAVPAALHPVLTRSLQLRPDDRFQSAQQMKLLLDQFLAQAGRPAREELGALVQGLLDAPSAPNGQTQTRPAEQDGGGALHVTARSTQASSDVGPRDTSTAVETAAQTALTTPRTASATRGAVAAASLPGASPAAGVAEASLPGASPAGGVAGGSLPGASPAATVRGLEAQEGEALPPKDLMVSTRRPAARGWLLVMALFGVLGLAAALGIWLSVPAAHQPTPDAAAGAPDGGQRDHAAGGARLLAGPSAAAGASSEASVTPVGKSSDGGATRTVPAPDAAALPTHTRPARAARRHRRTGWLEINTLPVWSEVRVAGRRRGPTPLRIRLPAGRHRLTLQPLGKRRVVKLQVTIHPGKTTRRILSISP